MLGQGGEGRRGEEKGKGRIEGEARVGRGGEESGDGEGKEAGEGGGKGEMSEQEINCWRERMSRKAMHGRLRG